MSCIIITCVTSLVIDVMLSTLLPIPMRAALLIAALAASLRGRCGAAESLASNPTCATFEATEFNRLAAIIHEHQHPPSCSPDDSSLFLVHHLWHFADEQVGGLGSQVRGQEWSPCWHLSTS